MNRWTIKELNETPDFKFAALILAERRAQLNPYSPLAEKLGHVIGVLMDEQEKRNNKEANG